jgi:subtilisin-like proprotein convertase family protein
MSEESSQQPPPDERNRTDATGEFFSVGTPLHAVRVGYVRRAADDVLFDTVNQSHYAHVLAPERSGKSSLVAATAARLEADGCKVAVLDLAQIGEREAGDDAGRWYYNVAYRLLRQLRIRYDLQEWWHDKSFLNNRQRLFEFYSEILLSRIEERVVVFVDGIQCQAQQGLADQLLASIRAAHNARTTDPDFLRLTFVLLGECDPVSLMSQPEMSPFNVTRPVALDDFTRDELALFATELNLPPDAARVALDRIYYWTAGQPYLCQKLARQVARDTIAGDVAEHVDHIATMQLAGRAALHSEPHMSHIHRAVAGDHPQRDALLNLFGRIRKGVEVSADLGSPLQRRLIAAGLVVIDHDGNLRVRNRLYERVFTTRWANESIRMQWRVPLAAAAFIMLLVLIPFSYTQWLPRPYMNVLTSPTAELDTALSAYENLRSFPGHDAAADRLLISFVKQRAQLAADVDEITAVANLAANVPAVGRLPERLLAGFWDRQSSAAMRDERRDTALLATLESLVFPTPVRRQRAAGLVADDLPALLASLTPQPAATVVFDPSHMLLSFADGARISQWTYVAPELQQRAAWPVTALEVVPLVRRVIVDREGTVARVGLTLSLSHARVDDLRIKIIAPSGRTVEIEPGVERASSIDDIVIPAAQLEDLIGESLAGTWSISVRDEALGVAGQLVGWNLKLNSQGAIEDFQRGLNIPDPVERETENLWFDKSGRYAVARAMQSDSARIWDLAFAEPVRVIAVNESETLIGLDSGARHLVTASQDSVNVWSTATGDRVMSLPVGAGSTGATLSRDGSRLFVERRGDAETRLERWSLVSGEVTAGLDIAGIPAMLAMDPTGTRIAVADYDRAVRVWDFDSGEMVAQIDLPLQPSVLQLAAGGETLGAVHGRSGVTLWNVGQSQSPLVQEFADGDWQLVFSSSGALVFAGRAEAGYQAFGAADGRIVGPALGVRRGPAGGTMLALSEDETVVLTGSAQGMLRFWRAPGASTTVAASAATSGQPLWQPSAGRVMIALPGTQDIAIGNPAGEVHILPAGAGPADFEALSLEVGYLGHRAAVTALRADAAGSRVASAAADNSIRVWDAAGGEPLPWTARIEGDAVADMAFSPSASELAVLRGAALVVLNVADGNTLAEFDLGETHRSLSFATESRIFVGSESGVLRQIARADDGTWSLSRLWQGEGSIRQLAEVSRRDYVVIADDTGTASLLTLADGQVGELSVSFPGPVEDIAVARSGTRAYVRTARWVHRVSLSGLGLNWVDSVIAPRPLHGARIIPGTGETAGSAFLLTAGDGFARLAEIGFPGSAQPGLLGLREELLDEWRARLGREAEND